MEMAYNGPYAVLDVPALSRTVERGVPVEIDDPHLRGQLHRQGWDYVHDDDRDNDENKDGDGS